MMNIMYLLVLVFIPYDVLGLPCLTTGSKKDFDDSRKALTTLKSYLDTTVNTLETDVHKTVATLKSHIKSVDGKIKTLDNDLQLLEGDFKGKFLIYDNNSTYFLQLYTSYIYDNSGWSSLIFFCLFFRVWH